ncbi:MAG: GNAT family N-acetyltransferase [Kiritimatiellae bacterium]|nr:GNAT family N-acetyltransferase [Kiritimatiellia bacterium]
MNIPETIPSARLVLERPHPPTLALAGEIFAAIDRSRATLRVWLPIFDAILRPEDELRFLEGPCTRGWESGRVFPYAIRLASTREFAGIVSLENVSDPDRSAEIGYWLDDAHVGRGFMREAVLALERTAFAAGFHRLAICNDTRNVRSANVALRTGHRLDGILRQNRWLPRESRYADSNVFSRLSTDPAP